MRKFLIAIAIAAVFALILLVAGTAQNEGCLPWKTPVTVGGGGTFSEQTGNQALQIGALRRSGAGVEPTEPWVARPHEF